MPKILAVGIATLDIINETDGYPQEDSEQRALSQHIRRGGNAANTLQTLAILGHECWFCGTLADDPGADTIRQTFRRQQIHDSLVTAKRASSTPTSYVTLNRANGSRTIVHHRDLDELSYLEFSRVDIGQFDWFHFEGRNIGATAQMIARVRALRPRRRVSVEIEKPRDNIETLIELADVVIFSRHYALTRQFPDASALLRHAHAQHPRLALICAWGADGAYFLDPSESSAVRHAAGVSVEQVVDTLAAGDCFNAGIIHGLSKGQTVERATRFANRIAAAKVQQSGIEGLGSRIANFRL